MDGGAARHGQFHFRDEHGARRQPSEHDHEEAHLVGRHHCGSDGGNRILRAKCAVPGVRQGMGIRVQRGAHRGDQCPALHDVQTQGMVMTVGSPASKATPPWWRVALVNRYAPYAAVIVLSALSPALPHKMDPDLTWWWAAVITIGVVFALMWTSARLPNVEWLATSGPLLFLVAVQLL